MRLMRNSLWRPFRTLRKQFLQASREGHRLHLYLGSFPGYDAYQSWHKSVAMPEIGSDPGPEAYARFPVLVWGDAAGVKRFKVLATAAGKALPLEFVPPVRLFAHWNPVSNTRPAPPTIWGEFLYLARPCHFETTLDWPAKGVRTACLRDDDPFLVSALAIDSFILGATEESLDEYRRDMSATLSWFGLPTTGAAATGRAPSPTPAQAAIADTMPSNAEAPTASALGIMLDHNLHTAIRERETADFVGKPTAWTVFVALCSRHPQYYATADLRRDAWGDRQKMVAAPNLVSTQIVAIKKLVRPLGVTVVHKRGQGYRLEPMPAQAKRRLRPGTNKFTR
jgi:hypothetical protein